MKKKLLMIFLFALISLQIRADKKIFAGADEKTPSRAEYFSWINNTNEGATEKHTLINLDFFKRLKEEYGMQLDIYAFDAGAIDGKRFYGSMKSDRFKRQFPRGFEPIYKRAKLLGIRLGLWGGPDGFGKTQKEEKERTEQMVKLCRDYDFALFKFDAVCGALRAEKEDAFINMMKECRKYSPDLILLNHRLGLKRAQAYATTFLWEGAETYIDVFMTNNTTAPHHRAGAISRNLVPDLKRLTEDHGVCISSCLDNWDDDLILQTFNRGLILSPQIYGNPWFLRDDEFPKLARIFNLHKKYKNFLINGKVLPNDKYGPNAVSRGDDKTRIISMRNLSWTEKTYEISLSEEIGLKHSINYNLIQIHPYEWFIGKFKKGKSVKVKVEPFRAALFIATAKEYNEPYILGTKYDIVRDIKNKSLLIDIVGNPGTKRVIRLPQSDNYTDAIIKGKSVRELLNGNWTKIQFPGKRLNYPVNRKISDMKESPIPKQADSLYEATVFAADNNALEVRSLLRSGKTEISEVKRARDAFFNQKVFIDRGVWDRNLFDSNMKTGFWPSKKYDVDLRIKRGSFRLDLGKITEIDELIFYIPDYFSLQPLLREEGNIVEVSKDLKTWKKITYLADLKINIPIYDKIRYFRFKYQPSRIVEIEGYLKGKKLDRRYWRASNLFAHSDRMKCKKAWKASFKLNVIPEKSYLSIALNGEHGVEGVYVAAKIGGKLVGSPDRAPSFVSNTWEYIAASRDSNYTYYIPLKNEYKDKKIEVFAMAYNEKTNIRPVVWLSTPNNGRTKVRLELIRRKK